MQSEVQSSLRSIRKAVPHSRMIFPNTFPDQVKYFVWLFYTPLHPFVRDISISLGIVSISKKISRWSARQQYLLGVIAPGETIEGVVAYLIENGYRNHFVAWEDDGEVVSLRYMENFASQYHLRIFEDGEVRGHYEFTPECYPIRHYYEVGFEDRRDEFLKVLGDRITPISTSLKT